MCIEIPRPTSLKRNLYILKDTVRSTRGKLKSEY